MDIDLYLSSAKVRNGTLMVNLHILTPDLFQGENYLSGFILLKVQHKGCKVHDCFFFDGILVNLSFSSLVVQLSLCNFFSF